MQNARNSAPNNSIIQPAGFYIVALSSMPYNNIYVMFLTVLYVITVICNVFLITIIFYDHRLHVPKFMAVGNLALVDLVLSTSLVPGMIKTYLVLDNFVPFRLCLVQMYIYYAFLFLESFSIRVLSYDRFVAICLPLFNRIRGALYLYDPIHSRSPSILYLVSTSRSLVPGLEEHRQEDVVLRRTARNRDSTGQRVPSRVRGCNHTTSVERFTTCTGNKGFTVDTRDGTTIKPPGKDHLATPLRQESINTNTRMAYIIVAIWIFGFTTVLYGTSSILTLSFCGSLMVKSYFCDYTPVLRLACSDTTHPWNFATALTILFMVVPLIFIFLTYMGILIAVFRMKNNQSRYKALATCTEHLTLVAIFYIPIFIIFNLTFFEFSWNYNVGLVCLSLSSLIPPCRRIHGLEHAHCLVDLVRPILSDGGDMRRISRNPSPVALPSHTEVEDHQGNN
ncbi:olfactory receptor 5B12-like [Megalobrama amblycephala]|uniref:olfactory receptor 5B12-like n=1 Tax=Megalobrama amblycephala TaxID=75352 RepID=UPI002014238E|nr:olfactory receptor 5B12-like [Megalobrama amblycephala]